MGQLTFNEKGKKGQKEDYEWLNIWCEETNDETLPRIALIGDSITQQSYSVVKNKLEGRARIDYLATSYSIASSTYKRMVESFFNDSNYEIVYFNYGLHGYGVTIEEYESVYREMLKLFLKKSKVVIGLTTTITNAGKIKEDGGCWKSVIESRNQKAVKLAEEFGLLIDDLYSISVELGVGGKLSDGIHFNESGNRKIGASKALSLKKVLETL